MLLSELKEVLWGPFEQSLQSDEAASILAGNIDTLAKNIARNLDQREDIVSELKGVHDDNLWTRLGRYWKYLESEFNPSDLAPKRQTMSEDTLLDLTTMLAKLERNLIAGLGQHQAKAIDHEPSVRRLIFHITTFQRIEDSRFYSLQSMTAQLLCNMISPALDSSLEDSITDQQLDVYLSGKREDDVIIRLLDSRDPKTNLATLHLIHNIVRDSVPRQERLLSAVGIQWLARILGRMDDWLDTGDGRFELSCSIFNAYIASGLHPVLYSTINPPSTSFEPITPAQTALLKLVDSFLSSPHPNPAPSPHSFMLSGFERMNTYALASLSSGLDDARLPKVLEGLVLVLEGLGSIGLACQERRDKRESGGGEEDVVKKMKVDISGIIGPIVSLLRALSDFMPRLRPSPANPVSNEAPTERSLGGIKVSLIQLLGILTYDDKSVSDQVRQHGGVQLVLSMTEVDELNPYLREHALFTVRNLMRNNLENQAIIKQMDPVGVLSDSGEVLPVPEKMKRQSQGATVAQLP